MYLHSIASTDEQLHLWTIINTNRKSIAQYDNQLRIKDI